MSSVILELDYILPRTAQYSKEDGGWSKRIEDLHLSQLKSQFPYL